MSNWLQFIQYKQPEDLVRNLGFGLKTMNPQRIGLARHNLARCWAVPIHHHKIVILNGIYNKNLFGYKRNYFEKLLKIHEWIKKVICLYEK